MEHPLSPESRARLQQRHTKDFDVASTVSIPLRAEECPEEFGDDLRLWCRAQCTGRWKQVDRSAGRGVVMTFETAVDATKFGALACQVCRASIDARAFHRQVIG